MADEADRRTFLATSAGLLAAAVARSAAGASPRPARVRAEDEPLFRISLAQWSLHRSLKAKVLDPLDFPRVAKVDFEIDAVEYVSTFYRGKATDFDYLADLRSRCTENGVRSLLIMIDGEGYLGDADPELRRTAVENHFKWIAAARFLGCHSIRVNAHGIGSPEEQAERAVDSLRRLARVGDEYRVNVIVENHGGISSDGEWLANVIAKANHPRVGSLPDFGNFKKEDGGEYDRYLGVASLVPYAKGVSAKSHDFDGQGNEIHTDYARMAKIVLDAGYRGYFGIEYEGKLLSEPDGIRATKRLLESVRERLAAGG